MLSKAKYKTVEKKLTRDVHEQTHKNSIHTLQSKKCKQKLRGVKKNNHKTIMCKNNKAQRINSIHAQQSKKCKQKL
jgi:hypothetical protein